MGKLQYSIEVYEDYAIIYGWLTSDILILLVRLCRKHGFTHLTHNEGNPGFKLVKSVTPQSSLVTTLKETQ